MSQLNTGASSTEADAFLARHPEVLIGREALEKAEDDAGGDTFSIVNKPLDSVILYQYFNADTLERVFAAALVNDQKALAYYNKQNRDQDNKEEDSKSCPGCGAGSSRQAIEGPDRFLAERMIKCKCPKAPVGRLWPA